MSAVVAKGSFQGDEVPRIAGVGVSALFGEGADEGGFGVVSDGHKKSSCGLNPRRLALDRSDCRRAASPFGFHLTAVGRLARAEALLVMLL
jgi:hypothetical protein